MGNLDPNRNAILVGFEPGTEIGFESELEFKSEPEPEPKKYSFFFFFFWRGGGCVFLSMHTVQWIYGSN